MSTKKILTRLWSFLPGFMAWGTILGLLLLSFTAPNTVLILVLIYAIYWLVKVFIITGHLVVGTVKYNQDIRKNWHEQLKKDFPGKFENYYHLAIVPTYKEDITILRHTLSAIANSSYNLEKILVAVAFEERDKENAKVFAKILSHEFGNIFGQLFITFHPSDIAGEVRGKGPNITYCAREITKEILKNHLAQDVIVTTLDADNRVDKNYFANLTWNYCNTPDPLHKSFQPIPMFFNNIWKVPLPVKITALGSSFWQIIQAMRPHYARNFSAHAQSLEALIATDYWSVTTVVEDGHQYWRTYFRFHGNHHVVPMFVPVYMDAVQGEDLYDTFREQYLQRRRWFWGVSDIPYVFEHSFGNSKIPFLYKWLQFFRLVEAHYSLSTQSFILLIGWLPLFLYPSFENTVLGYNFPIVYRTFLTAAWIGLIANMSVASMLVPPRPGNKGVYALTLLKEWVLAPIMLSVSAVLFSALPALDSQTRLMLNKPFTVFNVTKKAAVQEGVERHSLA
ncbi:glycosyltransferase family 2 protein [Candidatus Berkelbacteria bacterium]|nr:glycosyltransferase family 2 protein [Candidatus Berkelbacteria bacterium]